MPNVYNVAQELYCSAVCVFTPFTNFTQFVTLENLLIFDLALSVVKRLSIFYKAGSDNFFFRVPRKPNRKRTRD